MAWTPPLRGMLTGMLGTKVGMTEVFTEKGTSIPVTVIAAGPCSVVQHKTPGRDGYSAVQLGYRAARESRVTASLKGHFAKAGVAPMMILREFPAGKLDDLPVGKEIRADLFSPGEYVDVTGLGKGKGFSGGVKRWNFRGGPATHGSMSHRRVGSIGASSWPSRVFPGAHMEGRLGGGPVTVHALQVVKVDPQENLLVLRGAVPGPARGVVVIRKTVKRIRPHVEQAARRVELTKKAKMKAARVAKAAQGK